MFNRLKKKKDEKEFIDDMDSVENFNPNQKPKRKLDKKIILIGILVLMFIIFIVSSVFLKDGSSNVSDKPDAGIDLEKSPIPISIISEDLRKVLISDIKNIAPKYKYGVDSVKILEMHPKNIEEKHKKIIETKVTGDAKPIVFNVKALGESPEANIEFEYELLYINFSDKWHLINSDDIDTESWKYVPSSGVSFTEVLDVLKETNFEGFEDGYIGNLDHTEVSLNYHGDGETSQKDLLKQGISLVDAKIDVSTEFAKYKTEKELEFLFSEEGWKLKDKNLLSKNIKWDIEYFIEDKPKEHSTDYIMNLVSNEDSYFSKVINFNNVKSYTLNKPTVIPNQFGVGMKYGLNVEYEDLVIITYDIIVPMEWTGASWVDKEVKIDIGSAVFNNGLGLWFAKETGDTLILEDLENFISDKAKDMQKIQGRVFKKDDQGKLTEYQIEITPSISLRAEAFSGKTSEVKGSPFSLKEVIFSLNDKTIKIADTTFKKVERDLGYAGSNNPIEEFIKVNSSDDKENKPQEDKSEEEKEDLENSNKELNEEKEIKKNK